MRVATHITFAASRKEPLAELAGRIRQAFLDAALPDPTIRFTLIDAARLKASPLDRVLHRYPEMQRFFALDPIMPGSPTDSRMLTNVSTGEPVDYATLQAILAGVPRSYPLGAIWLHFYVPVFGDRMVGLPKMGNSLPGVIVTDVSWVTGRQRALWIYTVVEASESDQKLPPNPEQVDAVIKALGKIKGRAQVRGLAPGGGIVGGVAPANAEAVKAIVADYRAGIKEIVERAGLPHDLPPAAEIRGHNLGITAGPRKPALEAVFKPMGYSCRGGSGQFHLTRRSSGNLVIELYLDVGTWSHQVSAIFLAQGAGFKASLGIPVAPRDIAFGQYPIGDAAQWQKIVENLAAMVRELDNSFVPEIEQAAGPTPAWYQPAG